MVSNRPLGTFFLFAFSFTWGWMFLMYGLFVFDFISFEQIDMLNTLAYLGPFASAIITSKMYYGKPARAKLIKSMFKPVAPGVVLFALLPLVFLGLAFLVYTLTGGKWYDLSIYKTIAQLPRSGVISTAISVFFYGLFVEVAWRGFALPHLQQKAIAITATLIIAFLSALWFIPIFMIKMQLSDQALIGVFCTLITSSVILTYIYNMSHGSVTACTIFQFCISLASVFSDRLFILVINGCLLLTAFLIVWSYKGKNLSGQRRISSFFGEVYY